MYRVLPERRAIHVTYLCLAALTVGACFEIQPTGEV
jgi:hypothetical protein